MEHNAWAVLSTQLANATEDVGASSVAVLTGDDGAFVSSGLAWREGGVIVTTAHSLKKAGELSVLLPDGRTVPATLKGKVRGFDLAILTISESLPLPRLGDPGLAKPGQLMLVAGRSLDTGVNATVGAISAVSGPWQTWTGGNMQRFIRLDVALFAGVDGGAVVDSSGAVIGLATSALSRIAGVVIPRETVDAAIDSVLAGKGGEPAFLGVGLHEIDYQGGRSPIVLSVDPKGAAASGGIFVGDLITSLDGKPVGGIRDLWALLNDSSIVGRPVEVGLVRGGEPVKVTVTLQARSRE
jgi:S1-C subfamily serine protease